ncbi:MAG: hypothetical protein JKY92_08165 [Magnetovibrio sp.]|nr:hypothetical protein [Magnetovibrio sp.]
MKTFQDGTKYIGAFQNSLAHGQGMWTLPNGDICEGEFVDGLLPKAGMGKKNGEPMPCFMDEIGGFSFKRHN